MRARVAGWLRAWAERLDPEEVPEWRYPQHPRLVDNPPDVISDPIDFDGTWRTQVGDYATYADLEDEGWHGGIYL